MAKAKVSKSKVVLKEKCPKCQAKEFAESKDMHKNRHCLKCRNVWSPLSKIDLENLIYKEKYGMALDFARSVKHQMDSLLTEIDLLGGDMSSDDISKLAKQLKKESEIVCSQSISL